MEVKDKKQSKDKRNNLFYGSILVVFLAISFRFILSKSSKQGYVATTQVKGSNDLMVYFRALYSDYQPDTCTDYLAKKFLGGPKKAIANSDTLRWGARGMLHWLTASNTLFFTERNNYLDRAVIKALKKNRGIKQVVIVAAGYDTRSYRFSDFPKVKFYEVDLPHVTERKEMEAKALEMPFLDRTTYVGADLASVSLKDALETTETFNASKPTVYIVEGLVYYLPQEVVETFFAGLREVAAPGSTIAYDYGDICLLEKSCAGVPKLMLTIWFTILKLKKEPWLSGMAPSADDHKAWLKTHKLKMDEHISFYDATEKLGVETWTKSPVMSTMKLVTASVPGLFK